MSIIEAIVLIIGILALLLAMAGVVAFFSLRRLWRWLEEQLDDLFGQADGDRDGAARLPHTPTMSARRPSETQKRPFGQT